MIVCSCAVICDRAIAEAIESASLDDAPLTCGAVYRRLGKRPRCGNCRPLMAKIIAELDERAALCPATGAACAAKIASEGLCDEGRRQGSGLSQPRPAERVDGRKPVLAALPAS